MTISCNNVLRPAVVAFIADKPMYPLMSDQLEVLRAWAIEQGAPRDFEVPAKLQSLPTKGCTIVDADGSPVYLLCFLTRGADGTLDGGLVHLLASKADFRNWPEPRPPRIDTDRAWSFASWTSEDVIYSLATPEPAEILRQFIGMESAARSQHRSI